MATKWEIENLLNYGELWSSIQIQFLCCSIYEGKLAKIVRLLGNIMFLIMLNLKYTLKVSMQYVSKLYLKNERTKNQI